MTIAQQAVSVAELRRTAVAASIARIRQVERAQGVTPAALREIRAILLELAARRELFPPGDFPSELNEHGHNAIYQLAADPVDRLALVRSTSRGAKQVPPHNHTTWAVIVGVQGEEENFFYAREDDGSVPGRGILRRIGHETVRPGSGVCMMPEHIHHIETEGDSHTLHLHMYGLALHRLDARVAYNVAEGSYRVFPATQYIKDAR
jgi:predicted metal-dependent enzyme (double-stranded beta helix superfamily)